MNVVPMVQVVENDVERAKARFVAAYQRGIRETAAEALFLSGMRLSGAEIGALVGHKKGWANRLIAWARSGFEGPAFPLSPSHIAKRKEPSTARSSLESQKNSDPEDREEDAEEARPAEDGPEFLLTCAGQADHRAQLFLKHLPEVQLNAEQTKQILDFIHKAITKWERIRRKLEKTNG